MPDKGNFNAVIQVVGNGQLHDALTPSEEVSKTLNCLVDPMKVICIGNGQLHDDTVAYGLDRASYNQGKNAKYDFSIEEEKAQPLVARGPGGVCKVTQLERCVQTITKE